MQFFKHMETPLGMTAEDLKDDNEMHKNIVQMDIKADEEGYIYFNELLYKVMKKTYGIKHIRNKKLADYEANTFLKINKIQEKMSNFLISEDKKATAVNPFLAIMYHNISFKTWVNMARKRMELEAINENLAGSEQSNDDFSDIILEADEKSNNSEGSYHTFRISIIASSSNFSENQSEESESDSPGIETITEHEQDDDRDNPDASFNNIKGKRLFADEEEERSSYTSEESKEARQIKETDEKKEEDVYSDGAPNIESRESKRYFAENEQERGLDKRKSSCPAPENYHLPNIEKDDDLNVIEENKLEQTFSVDHPDHK